MEHGLTQEQRRNLPKKIAVGGTLVPVYTPTRTELRSEQGVLRKEFEKLLDWLRDEPLPGARPHVADLSLVSPHVSLYAWSR